MSEENIGERILHILSIYPRVSPSMLQIALNIPAGVWKPVLEALIQKRHIARIHVPVNAPTGRHQTYTILSLGDDAPVKVVDLEAHGQGLNSNGTYATI